MRKNDVFKQETRVEFCSFFPVVVLILSKMPNTDAERLGVASGGSNAMLSLHLALTQQVLLGLLASTVEAFSGEEDPNDYFAKLEQ